MGPDYAPIIPPRWARFARRLPGEVDWTNGYVIRERSKTGVKTKHKLWTVTFELLKKYRPMDALPEEPVFLTEKGLPLVRRLIVNGKFYYSDAVRNAFIRLMLKAKLNGSRGFYCLRKTGASLIESIDPAATEMYLSHVENGMKKHYAERDWGRLERALLVMAGKLKGVLKTEDGEAADSTGAAAMAFCGDGI